MTDEITNTCDKCHTIVINGKCSCGTWVDIDKAPNFLNLLEKSILAFDFQHEQGKIASVFTGNHPSGVCIALWYGDYESAGNVKKFIYWLKKSR